MPEKKFEVEYTMTFTKVAEDGSKVTGMVANIKYLDLEYAEAVAAEGASSALIDALHALGAARVEG